MLDFFQKGYSSGQNWIEVSALQLVSDHYSSFIPFVIAFLHGSVLPQEIERRQLLDDNVSSFNQLLDLLRVCHVLVLHEGYLQLFPEVRCPLGIFPSEIQQLHRNGKHVV